MSGLTDREAAERLREFEERHALFTFRCRDWSMWRVVRRTVHTRLVSLPMSKLDAGGGGLSRVGRGIVEALKFGRYLVTGYRADIVVKSFVSALREEEEGRFRDIYFDSLLDGGLRSFRIESCNSTSFAQRSRHALRPPQLDPVALGFLSKLLCLLLPSRNVQRFSIWLARLLEAELDVHIPADQIARDISAVRWQAALYELLLRRLRPSAVLVADTAEYPIMIAGRRVGIKTVELQHGLFDRDHPDAVPAGPDREPASLALPDILAAYGPFWKRQLVGTALPAERIVAVGCDAIDRARARRKARSSASINIVVTTQGIDRSALIDWLRGLVEGALSDLSWQMVIKLHPAYDPSPDPYDGLAANPNVLVVPGDMAPSSQDLLLQADWHLSISSACHYDALSLGVATVVIPLASHNAVMALVEEGAAGFCPTPADFWTLATRARKQRNVDPDDFCRPGFVSNMRQILA